MGPLFWLPTRNGGSKGRSSLGPTPYLPGTPYLWLRGDDAPTGVFTWPPPAGQSTLPTATNGGTAPTLVANAVNGHSAVEFFGSGYGMATAGLGVPVATETVFFVGNFNSDGFAFDGIGGSNRHVFFSNSGTLEIYAGSIVSGDPTPTTGFPNIFHLWSCVINGASSQLYQDGVLVGSGNAGAQSVLGYSIGGDYLFSSGLPGLAAEYYAVPVTTTLQRQSVESQLMGKYAIPTVPAVNTGFTRAINLMLVGDSITDRQTTTTATVLAAQYPNAASVAVLNRGYNGSSSADWMIGSGTGILTSAIAAANTAGVKTVNIMLCTNDASTAINLSPSAHKANIQAICNSLFSGIPALTGIVLQEAPYIVPGASGFSPDGTSAALTQAYFSTYSSISISGVAVGTSNSSTNFAFFQRNHLQLPDGIHPGAQGQGEVNYSWSLGLEVIL